jgi:hypothetical protein
MSLLFSGTFPCAIEAAGLFARKFSINCEPPLGFLCAACTLASPSPLPLDAAAVEREGGDTLSPSAGVHIDAPSLLPLEEVRSGVGVVMDTGAEEVEFSGVLGLTEKKDVSILLPDVRLLRFRSASWKSSCRAACG